MTDIEIDLKVCISCDAPLPCEPNKLNYFNKNEKICDDCLSLHSNEK